MIKSAFKIVCDSGPIIHLRSDERFYRPAEVHLLMGDCSKGKKILGWHPTVSFKELVQMMVEADLKYLKK
jgi:GDPmannose 4,6-dehydratase